MKEVKVLEKITWPVFDIQENFEFEVLTQSGTFNLHFRWLNNRWNLWVTFPDGSIRQAGVYPGVVSWSGFTDYGFYFQSNNENEIDYSSLLLTEAYLITWV